MGFVCKAEWEWWRFWHVRGGPFRRFEEWFFGCWLDWWERIGYAVAVLLYIVIAGSVIAAIIYEIAS